MLSFVVCSFLENNDDLTGVTTRSPKKIVLVTGKS